MFYVYVLRSFRDNNFYIPKLLWFVIRKCNLGIYEYLWKIANYSKMSIQVLPVI